MSIVSVYPCSSCKKEQEFERTPLVDVKENPELRKQILDGSFFQRVCRDCGQLNYIPYPVLYLDQDHGFMVYFSDGSENPMEQLIEGCRSGQIPCDPQLLKDMESSFVMRTVTSLNALCEKILLFERGLDDRAVEIQKIIMKGEVARLDPDLKVVQLFYCPRPMEKSDQFSILTEEGFGKAVEMVKPLYEEIKDKVLREVDPVDLSATVVDEAWAFHAIHYEEAMSKIRS